MSQKYFFTIVFCLVFILGISNTNIVFASTTDGTIDTTNKYAWGENIGWLNFGASAGNVHITDSGMTGSVWSENYGWINLHANGLSGGSVTNNGNGVLGGSAWGEGLGWISFSGVTINTSGVFSGYATIAKDGSQISFNCSNTSSCGLSDFKVSTDWRPISARSGGGGGGGGGGRGASCVDGIQNGTETGIDCGGICPLSCGVPPPAIPPIEQILGSGPCPVELIITNNMKIGVRNGLYSTFNKGVVTQVAILQAHINRILAASYNQAAGPVDGKFGPLTKQGVKRLQISLNSVVKPKPLLKIDGIVGPFTKAAINNSCGTTEKPVSVVASTSKVMDASQAIPYPDKINVSANIYESKIIQNMDSNFIIFLIALFLLIVSLALSHKGKNQKNS